jgi:hypothetical protein
MRFNLESSMKFFNQESTARQVMQSANALALAYVIYDFTTNPEATIASHGLEVVTLAFNFYSLKESVGSSLSFLASITSNSFALGSIYNGITQGMKTLPTWYNALGSLLHITQPFVDVITDESAPKNSIT